MEGSTHDVSVGIVLSERATDDDTPADFLHQEQLAALLWLNGVEAEAHFAVCALRVAVAGAQSCHFSA